MAGRIQIHRIHGRPDSGVYFTEKNVELVVSLRGTMDTATFLLSFGLWPVACSPGPGTRGLLTRSTHPWPALFSDSVAYYIVSAVFQG